MTVARPGPVALPISASVRSDSGESQLQGALRRSMIGAALALALGSAGAAPAGLATGAKTDAAAATTTGASTDEATHVASSLGDLGLALLRPAGPPNAVVSPLATAVALGMVHAGTDGKAEREIEALFGDLVPMWRDPEELATLVAGVAADPESTAARAGAARDLVIGAHTFDHRVAELMGMLVEHDLVAQPGDR